MRQHLAEVNGHTYSDIPSTLDPGESFHTAKFRERNTGGAE